MVNLRIYIYDNTTELKLRFRVSLGIYFTSNIELTIFLRYFFVICPMIKGLQLLLLSLDYDNEKNINKISSLKLYHLFYYLFDLVCLITYQILWVF